MDLVFSVLAEVRGNKHLNTEDNQKYLNSLEAWWIRKYLAEGFNVKNITKPAITINRLKQRFNEMVSKKTTLFSIEDLPDK